MRDQLRCHGLHLCGSLGAVADARSSSPLHHRDSYRVALAFARSSDFHSELQVHSDVEESDGGTQVLEDAKPHVGELEQDLNEAQNAKDASTK